MKKSGWRVIKEKPLTGKKEGLELESNECASQIDAFFEGRSDLITKDFAEVRP